MKPKKKPSKKKSLGLSHTEINWSETISQTKKDIQLTSQNKSTRNVHFKLHVVPFTHWTQNMIWFERWENEKQKLLKQNESKHFSK